MSDSIFFNAAHSPIGAFASFTLGVPGAKGGLGVELGKPADQNVFIGVETLTPNVFEALPFYEAGADDRARYDVEKANAKPEVAMIIPFARESIRREFKLGTDTWQAGDLTFRICSPVRAIPEPGKARAAALRAVLVPAVVVELSVDNTAGQTERRAFFGYQGNDPYSSMRRVDDAGGGKLVGIGQGLRTAIVARDAGVRSALGFTILDAVAPKIPANVVFGLGPVGALVFTVPPGKQRTVRFAVCFHVGGTVTANLATRYLYTRYFRTIESVGEYALQQFAALKRAAVQSDRLVDRAALSAEQKFMLSHALRAYYGSSEMLERRGRPFWVVNEGEYRMMNTFDLTVDLLFHELRLNPWVMRNVLEMFIERYSYHDQCGISFTHDMGVANVVSRPGYSTYELFQLDGCFSHMTHEQLVNWVLCAAAYVARTRDRAWWKKRWPIFQAALASLVNRDDARPARRDGIMGVDSNRCQGGAEITTYDSLDVSLGQARNNFYLGVKTWAAYLALEQLFGDRDHGRG